MPARLSAYVGASASYHAAVDTESMIFVNPGPDDGVVVVSQPEGAWSPSEIEAEVNKFYGDTEWRILESTWICPHSSEWMDGRLQRNALG